MNIIKKTLGALMAAGVVALCSCGPKLPELPVSEIQPYFADAAKTKAIDTAFYEVKDMKGNKLGTVLFSLPYLAASKTSSYWRTKRRLTLQNA